MIKTRFDSTAEFIQKVAESKAQYDSKRGSLTYEEKLIILGKLQEKAAFMGKLKIKPWPIK